MAKKPARLRIAATGKSSGRVEIAIMDGGSTLASLDMPAKDVGYVIVQQLSAANTAAQLSGQTPRFRPGTPLPDLSIFDQPYIALFPGNKQLPAAMVIFGFCPVGIGLELSS